MPSDGPVPSTPPELVMLGELVAQLAQLGDVDAIARHLAARLKWLLPVTCVTLLVLEDTGTTWRLAPGDLRGVRLALEGSLARALTTGAIVVEHDSVATELAAAFARDARSIMVLPLFGDAGPIGALNLSTSAVSAFPARANALTALLQSNVATAVVRSRYLADIRTLNATLGERVTDRTARLAQAVTSLQAEAAAREAAQSALRHQATHDPLTDLGNRRLLHASVEAALAAAQDRSGVAIVLLDLDDFKTINDSLGHAAGDQVLITIAGRIRSCLAADETAVRLGGDEFAIVIAGAGLARAQTLAEQLLQALRSPISIGDEEVLPATSIGLAVGADHSSPDVLLRNADLALYAAKHAGKGRWRVFEPELHARATERLGLISALRGAIENRTLALHHQPVTSVRDGRTVATEALARWHPSGRAPVGPDRFIPLAEQSGLIKPLTRWALETALDQSRELARAGFDLYVAVNLSVRDLHDEELPEFIAVQLAARGVAPRHLTVEVTEGMLIDDPQQAIDVLTMLRGMGVGIAVDDFGTGYSSLAYLKRLPITHLKIDQAFIRNLVTDRSDRAIVRSTINLAHELGLQVVAEGVEDEPTWDVLATLECDLIQGYLISRPLPFEHLLTWLGEGRVHRLRAA